MSDFSHAVNLIRKYEGFSEKAYPDPDSGGEPYTIGYGTQFYPDGTPVKQGQCCSKQKALEYLFHEVQIIDIQLSKLNLGLDDHMRQALISFIHSVGWESFLYSSIVDLIEIDNRFRWFLPSFPEIKVTDVGISTISANGGIIVQPPKNKFSRMIVHSRMLYPRWGYPCGNRPPSRSP